MARFSFGGGAGFTVVVDVVMEVEVVVVRVVVKVVVVVSVVVVVDVVDVLVMVEETTGVTVVSVVVTVLRARKSRQNLMASFFNCAAQTGGTLRAQLKYLSHRRSTRRGSRGGKLPPTAARGRRRTRSEPVACRRYKTKDLTTTILLKRTTNDPVSTRDLGRSGSTLPLHLQAPSCGGVQPWRTKIWRLTS